MTEFQTPMAQAMQKAANKVVNGGAFKSHVKQAVQRGVGVKRVPSWNASLSFRTAQTLSKLGILPSRNAAP